jgi:hypothetical protein
MREKLPSNQELIKAEKRIADWKEKYGDRDASAAAE